MKTRKTQRVPNHPGISRVLVLDKKSGRWIGPSRGDSYVASRYVRQADGRNQKVRRSFSTFAEANAFRRNTVKVGDQSSAVDGNNISQEKPTGITFAELKVRWKKDWLPHKALSTQIRYKSYLQHFGFFSEMCVERIEPTDIDNWLSHIKSPEYLAQFHTTRCSYSHEFSVLRRIFGFYATRFNRNYRVPLISEHRRMLKVRDKPKQEKDLTLVELRLFLETLKSMILGTRFEVVYYLALMQYGVYGRVQEAAALHCEDFNITRNEITLNKKVIWPRAKGMAPFLADGAKTDGGKKIPMSALAKQIFQEWKIKSGVRMGLLFTMNGKLLTYRQIEERYTLALRKAGLPFSATHVLRHASLTEYYDTSKDLLLTQKVAGHRDLRATTRYTKVRNERLIETQLAMDKKLSELVI